MSFGLIAFCWSWGQVEEYYTESTDTGDTVIPKFNGSNYKRWASKIEVALKSIGAWRIVTGEFKDPGKTSSIEQQYAYKILNDRGYDLIRESLDQEILESLDGLKKVTGCREAWNLFQFTFSDASLESMFQKDILEDIHEVNDFKEKEIKEWMKQRQETIKIVEVWYKRLKWLAKGAKIGEVLSDISSLCGNVISVVSLFFPQISLMGRLMLFARYARNGGTYGTFGTQLVEAVGSEAFLLKVRAALKKDAKKSARLRETVKRMARVDIRLRSDFDVSLWQYIWFRLKCKGNPRCRVPKTKIFKGLRSDSETSLGYLRFARDGLKIMGRTGVLSFVGDKALRGMGCGEDDRKKILGAIEICVDLISLYARIVENNFPEYVTSVESELETLKDELKKVSRDIEGKGRRKVLEEI